MTVFRAAGVRFVRDGTDLVVPFSLVLGAGESGELAQPTPFAASLAARLCGAIVRPSGGTIFIGDYETRLQPPQAKRRVGFVDAAGFLGDAHAFECEVAFHAECFGVARVRAHARASEVIAALGRDDAYARAIALALVPPVALLVLDRAHDEIVRRVRDVVPEASILVTVVA